MIFPYTRMRRLRNHNVSRNLVRETHLTRHDLMMPLFVVEGLTKPEEITSMPGVMRFGLDHIGDECSRLWDIGVESVILFGIPAEKDAEGTGAWLEDGIVQQAVERIRKAAPEMYVVTDVCMCEYTSHGHCGIIRNNTVDNDPTLDLLSRTALSHAQAGAHMVAPSDMMDGRIEVIRQILDENGFEELPIMAYSAKYASAFYGPFRDAAESAPAFGDRRAYQMDPANAREAIREVELDIQEGADIVMVKPALAYMDIIRTVRNECRLPVAAYNVSGEYSMVKAAAAKGWIDEQRIALELLTGLKRAGADIILSYHTQEIMEVLRD